MHPQLSLKGPAHATHAELPQVGWRPPLTTLFQCSVTALAISSLLLVGCTPCTSYCLVYLRSVCTCTQHTRRKQQFGLQSNRQGCDVPSTKKIMGGKRGWLPLGRATPRGPHPYRPGCPEGGASPQLLEAEAGRATCTDCAGGAPLAPGSPAGCLGAHASGRGGTAGCHARARVSVV